MMRHQVLFVLALVASGCSTTRIAKLVEFETGEILTGKFTDSAATGGSVQVRMPSGELLTGRYSAVREKDELTFTSATVSANAESGTNSAYFNSSGFGTQRTVGGQGKAYALLTSSTPGSKLVMEIIVTYGVLDGHGFGEARTNDGRSYRVQF